jgi:predicted permease
MGFLFAGWTMRALRGTLASVVPRHEEIRLDLGVLGFSLVISLLSVLAASLLPALRAAGSTLQTALAGGGRGAPTRERWRLSQGLMTLEIALSVVLVIGASLLAKSFWKLRQEPLGFETAGLQTFKLRPPGERYGDETRRALYFQQVLERLSGIPGVHAAGAVNMLPLAGADLRAPLLTHGQEVAPGEMPPLVSFRVVTPELLRALGVPLLQGRALTAADRPGALNVGLVNQALARAVWPGADPLGKELLRPDGNPWFTVVGVVGDTRFSGLDVNPEPQAVLPLAQNAWPSEMFFVVRVQDPPAAVAALESAVWSVDDEVPVSELTPLADAVRRSLGTERRLVGLLAASAGLALALAAVGVYGVTSQTIHQQRFETGVRMAFGATAASVVRAAVGRLVPSIAIGLIAGAAGAFGLTRFLAAFLYDVHPTDRLVFGAVLLLLGGWALLVGYLPARRAAAVDPIVVLRMD